MVAVVAVATVATVAAGCCRERQTAQATNTMASTRRIIRLTVIHLLYRPGIEASFFPEGVTNQMRLAKRSWKVKTAAVLPGEPPADGGAVSLPDAEKGSDAAVTAGAGLC